MIKHLLLVMLGGMVVNNYAFEKLLGICPIIGGKAVGKKSVVTGAFIALVMLLTTAICWPVDYYFLIPNGLEYLELFVYVIVVLDIVYLLELVMKKEFKESLGLYFPVIAVNAAVIGVMLNNSAAEFRYPIALFAALGAGLGYMLAMFIFSGVQSRIQQKYLPDAFKGLPANVLAAAIISMALVAFK